jgi:hypothetical protein
VPRSPDKHRTDECTAASIAFPDRSDFGIDATRQEAVVGVGRTVDLSIEL